MCIIKFLSMTGKCTKINTIDIYVQFIYKILFSNIAALLNDNTMNRKLLGGGDNSGFVNLKTKNQIFS